MKDPFSQHPCWRGPSPETVERIHLPVARSCNVKCSYCNGLGTRASHSRMPGYSAGTMSVDEAVRVFRDVRAARPKLRIAAVSGPGDPLASMDSLALFQQIRMLDPEIDLCLCTNGLGLGDSAAALYRLGVSTLSVSMSALSEETAARVYEWAVLGGLCMSGPEMGRRVIQMQLQGIEEAVRRGIHVKVNSIVLPGVNEHELPDLASVLKDHGVELHNIVPLVPGGTMSHCRPPTSEQVESVRRMASRYIRQFRQCAQCRSDVVGVPGCDTSLL
ncbi:MAG: radical SAM protein [Candidatus Thorarchaeota archaeon]|nr:radical SAM protein [Candidatus Thorarchaeota archaeon]